MRRLLAALLVLSASLPIAPATAQTEASVRLRLVEQSLWNGPLPGRRVLELRLRIENHGPGDLVDLARSLSVYLPARGRLEYEASLTGDPTGLLFGDPLRAIDGPLKAGESRDYTLRHQLDPLHDRSETGVYPMKLELRSQDALVATLRSPLIYVAPNDAPDRELVPLSVGATFVLAERLRQDATGTFLDRVLEASVAEDGSLRSLVAELESTEATGMTVTVSPLLLRQLADMRDGYRVGGEDPGEVSPTGVGARGAAAVLEALGRVAAREDVDLAVYPFAAPSLPALAAGGLDADIARQLDRGESLTQSILGRAPDRGLLRPPLGLVDAGSLRALEEARPDGFALLLDPGGAIPPEEDQGFNPVATGRLSLGNDDDLGAEAILPSESVAGLVEDLERQGDPVLAAQAILGELATIYNEVPGQRRGVAMILGEPRLPAAAFARRLLDGLNSLPILRAMGAGALLSDVPPLAELPLVERTPPRFETGYEASIRDSRLRIGEFLAMFPQREGEANALTVLVLLAETQQFLHEPETGRAFLTHVDRRVRDAIREIKPPPEEVFTLTSRNGRVPVTLRNRSGTAAEVRLTLLSSALQFPDGRSHVIKLERAVETMFFDVRARRGGRFAIDVLLCPPHTVPAQCDEAGEAFASSRLVIRSTVYNRVALFLTIGAALFLLAGWGRRVLKRPRS